MGKEVKIAYICDGLDKCSDSVMCFRRLMPGSDCKHTFNPGHAANGVVEHPEDHPDRFHLVDTSNDEICWWEGDIYIP